MKNFSSARLITVICFAIIMSISATLGMAQQKIYSTENAEQLFAEKKWQESLEAYRIILPKMTGDDLDKTHDRLGDINLFLGNYKESCSFYKKVFVSILERKNAYLKQAQKSENLNGKTMQLLMLRLDILDTMGEFVEIKMKNVAVIPQANLDDDGQKIQKKMEEYIALYHEVIAEEGFDINLEELNLNVEKLKNISDECVKILSKYKGLMVSCE